MLTSLQAVTTEQVERPKVPSTLTKMWGAACDESLAALDGSKASFNGQVVRPVSVTLTNHHLHMTWFAGTYHEQRAATKVYSAAQKEGVPIPRYMACGYVGAHLSVICETGRIRTRRSQLVTAPGIWQHTLAENLALDDMTPKLDLVCVAQRASREELGWDFDTAEISIDGVATTGPGVWGVDFYMTANAQTTSFETFAAARTNAADSWESDMFEVAPLETPWDQAADALEYPWVRSPSRRTLKH